MPAETSSPLRIIHYLPGMKLALGGVVRAVIDWCNVLSSRGHEVILVTYDSTDVPGVWDGLAGRPRVVWIPESSRPNWFVPKQSVRMWNDVLSGGGIVHLHCPWTASNIQMARAARRAAIPHVVSIHGMLNDWPMRRGIFKKRVFLAVGGRRYLRLADRLHFTAAAERDQALKWIPGAHPVVMPYLVDLSPYTQLPGAELARTKYAIARDVPTLLFLSRLHEQKGVDLLIDAAASLRSRGRRFQLLLAGSAAALDREYELSLIRQIQCQNLSDTIRFLGLVTGTEKISLYQAADLFILPTRHENFGLVLIEAMAAGAPVLTTRGTNIWQEIADHGGRVTDTTAGALCDSISGLLDDRAALAESGRQGRAWVMQRFAVDKFAADYENLYRRIIAEHQRPA